MDVSSCDVDVPCSVKAPDTLILTANRELCEQAWHKGKLQVSKKALRSEKFALQQLFHVMGRIFQAFPCAFFDWKYS